MNFQKFFFVFMMSLASTYVMHGELTKIVDEQVALFSINPLEDGFSIEPINDIKRGYLPVPASVNLGSNLSTQILSPTTLGVTTTNLSAAGVYRLTKNSSYTPAATGGSPAIRISGTGVDLDFSHNSFCFSRSSSSSSNPCFPSATSSSSSSSSTCNTHCVGIEIGYGPNFASGITQPDNVVVENGIMCNWDIAILIHAGVRNVIIRNMVFTDNVIPVIAIGQNNAQGFLEKDISNITLENVSILGANQAQLTCLKWIRMYLSNGAVIPPITLAATGPEGYVNNEVMLLEGNPVEDVYPDYITFGNTNNDVGLGLYVYPGIYFYGVTNVQFKNVSISNIGFDGNLTPGEPSAVAERTAAYGMWFRNCTSIFMQDVDASYTCSGLVAVGAYFDDCEVISIKNGQFTQTGLNLLETAYPTPVFTPEGLWAAGMVLKDSNSLNMSHVVLSHTLGLDSAWGLRTIHSYYTPSVITYPLYSPTIEQYSQNFEFTDVWADSLRGDHVFGYDFGDLYRKVLNTDQFSTGATSNGVIPAGAIHALKMHNVSSCSCLGKLGLTSELLIAKEYKGIYLGDQSSAIRIDGVRIEGNNIASGSTVIGINSGIEFGAVSTVLNNPTTVGQAQGTIFDASFNNVNIARNIGGYQNFEFCGMRAVSTGVIVPQVVGVNTFDTISITNSRFDRNQFEGFRAVDDIDNLAPITIQRLVMNNVSLSNNADGHGATFQTLLDSDLVKLKCNLNNTVGFSVQTLIDSVSIVESEFNGTTSNAADVIGFDIATAGNCVNFVKTKFGFNSAVDGNATGLHVLAGQSISLKDCSADCNGSTLLNLTGPFTTRGIFFDTSIDNVEFLNVEANNNESGCGNCYGFEIDRATAIYADGMHANNNQAAGVITQNNNVAQVCGIFFKAAVGSAQSEGCYLKDLQACGNFNAYQAFGIHMQSPTGIVMENIDASSNLSDATGQINNLPVLSQAIGLFMEGGNSVSICDLHTNSNQQAEINAVNLSRYLSLGITSADSEANLNLSGFIAHHFPVANLSGAYGTFINGTNDLMIEHGSSGKNEGVRAFGMHARNAVNVFVKDIDASENHGLGTPWFTENPFIGLNPTAVSIPNVQAQCFFGGLDPAAKINLVSTFENLLQGLAQFANQESTSSVGETDNVPAQRVVLGYTLIWSTLAQFRRFCTGVGFGFYESDFPTLEKCRALGNYSEQDSGGGVALYGSAQGALVCDCVTADNRCYDVSERGGEGSFNINGSITDTEWNKFYTFLNVGLLNSQTLVTVNPTCSADQYGFIAIPDTIVTDTNINAPQAKPTQLTQPEQPCNNTDTWVLNSRDVTVGFPGTALPTLLNANTPLYNLVAPAPLGVGILVECQRDAFVGENNSYGNKGNAGCCAGIMSDAGSSTMFLDNKATSNAADVMGFAWGLADMTYSTPNIWYKNWMYANRVDTFMNSSYLITFDTIVSQNQQLPIVVIYPGSTEALSGALPLDNIIVSFVNDRQVYDCLGDDISQTWKCLQFASPLGSTFSDEYYGGPDQFLQIQAQEKRQLDFGGFISNLAGTGTQTQRAAASAAYDYMKDPFRAIPDITHITEGQGYVANDTAWLSDTQLLVVASGTTSLYLYNASLQLQTTWTATELGQPGANALSVDVKGGTYAVIGFDNGSIVVYDISTLTISKTFTNALGAGIPINYVRFSNDVTPSPGQHLVAMSNNGLGSAGVYCSFNTSSSTISTWVAYYASPVTASGPLVDVSWQNVSSVGTNFAMVLTGTQEILVDTFMTSAPTTLNYTGQFANNATCLSFTRAGSTLFVGQKNGTMNVIYSNGITPSDWTLVYTTPNLTITNGTTSDFVRVAFDTQSSSEPLYFVVTTQNNELPNDNVVVRVFDLTSLAIGTPSEPGLVQMGDARGLPLYDVASTTNALAWSADGSELAVGGSNGVVALQSTPQAFSNIHNTDVISVAANNNTLAAQVIAVNSLSKRLAVASTVFADCSIWDVSVQPAVAISISSAVATALFVGNPDYSAKLAWSLDGNYLYSLIANGTNLAINVIDTSVLPYTVTTTFSTAFTGRLEAVDIVTVDGNDYLAVALSVTPFVQIYEFNRSALTLSNVSGSTFATILDPNTTSGNSVAFNSFGTRLIVGATVSSDANTLADVNVTNPAAPVLIEYIPAHTGLSVSLVAFSSDDVTIASYGADGFIVLTDLTNELSPVTIATSLTLTYPYKLIFSPDGTRLAAFPLVGSQTIAYISDMNTLNAQTLLNPYTVDPLVSSTFYDAAWDSFNNLYVGGSGSLAQIDFVNSTVAQAAYQSLNPRSFDMIQLYSSDPASCAFSQDGNYIFQLVENAVLVYNTQGVVVRTFGSSELGLEGVMTLTAHPQQNMIVLGGFAATGLQTLVMVDCSNVDPSKWAIFTGNYNAAAISGTTYFVTAAQFNLSGTQLAVSYSDLITPNDIFVALFNVVDPFNPTSWTIVGGVQSLLGTDVDSPGVTSIAWQPDGLYFAVAAQIDSPTGKFYVFNTTSWGAPAPITLPTVYNPTCVSFNFNGSLLAVLQADNNVVVYNSSNATPSDWTVLSTPATFASLTDAARCLFHPTQNILLVQAAATTSYILDCRDGNLINWTVTDLTTTAEPSNALAWNSTGTIAQLSQFVIDTSSPDLTQWAQVYAPVTNAGLTGFASIAMNPMGNVLASNDGASHVTTWDVTNKTSTLVSTVSQAYANQVAWSTDGYYLFSVGVDHPVIMLNVFDPNNLSVPVASSSIISSGTATSQTSLAVITVNGVDYLAIGLNGSAAGNTISIVQYTRTTGTFSELFSGATGPLASLTTQVNSVAWNMNTAGVVTLLTGGNTGQVGYFTFTPSTTTITSNWLTNPNVSVHGSTNVSAVAMSPDGTLLMSGDAAGLLAQHLVTTGAQAFAPVSIPDSDQVAAMSFSHDGQRLAVVGNQTTTNNSYVYNVSTLYTQVPAVVPTLATVATYLQEINASTLQGAPNSIVWDSNDIDLFIGAANAITCINEINPLTFAIAQDMVNNSDNLTLGANIANSLCDFAQLTDLATLNITSADISSAIISMQTYLASNPTNLMGAVRTLQATALGTALQASTSRSQASLASANRMQSYMSVDLYHPIDAATIALSQSFGLPSEQVQNRAADIYLYTEQHLSDDPITAAPLSADPFLQAVATVINNNLTNGSAVSYGILILQTAYPQATYPGLASQIANLAYEYLLTNSDDILGATFAMNLAFVQAGIPDANGQLCLALGGYMVAYINAAQQLLTFGGMNSAKLISYSGTLGVPTVAEPAGSGTGYEESYRISTGIYDALRTNPSENQAAATSILIGTPLDFSYNLQYSIIYALTSSSVSTSYVNIATAVPTALAKQLSYSIQTNASGIDNAGTEGIGVGGVSGIALLLQSNNLMATAIAAAVVGSGWASLALEGGTPQVMDPTNSASPNLLGYTPGTEMTLGLLLGVNGYNQPATLLPSGAYLQALTGTLVNVAATTTYPAASVSSVFTTGAFASLGAYLQALADDLLAQGFTTTTTSTPYTGLIAANVNYAALNAAAQAAVARAIVLRTLITGDEALARSTFSNTTNSAIIASIVSQIMTGNFSSLYNAATYATGTAAAPSFSSTATYALSTETKQQIAAVAVMFYDTIGAGTGFAGDLVNVMIKSAYNASTAVQGLTANQQAFMAVIGGLGACAAFSEIAELTVPGTSTDYASQVGTQLALGLFDAATFMTAYDIGTIGQDGIAVDLSDQLLTAITAVIVLETCASSYSLYHYSIVANVGAYAAPLAYNQIFTDTLMRSVAILSTEFDPSYGQALLLEADPTLNSTVAETIAQSALGQSSTSRARNNVAQAWNNALYAPGTTLSNSVTVPVEQAGFITLDVSWSADSNYLFAVCANNALGVTNNNQVANFLVVYNIDGNIVAQFACTEFGESANSMLSVSARPSATNTNSYVAVGFTSGNIQVINISNSLPSQWEILPLQTAFIDAVGGATGSNGPTYLHFSPDGNHLVGLNFGDGSSAPYASFATPGTISGLTSWTIDYSVVASAAFVSDFAWRDNTYFAFVFFEASANQLYIDQVGTSSPVNATLTGALASATHKTLFSVCFTPAGSGQLCLLGQGNLVGADNTGVIYSIPTGTGGPSTWTATSIFATSSLTTIAIGKMAVNPAGNYLMIRQENNGSITHQINAIALSLYDIATTTQVGSILNLNFTEVSAVGAPVYPPRFYHGLSWSANGNTLGLGGDTGIAYLNTSSGTPANWILPAALREMSPQIVDCAWTPDGLYLFAGCTNAVTDYDNPGLIVYNQNMEVVATFTPVALYASAQEAVTSVAVYPEISSGNYMVAVGFEAGGIAVVSFNATSLSIASTVTFSATTLWTTGTPPVDYVRFSPNGSSLVAVSAAVKKYSVINSSLVKQYGPITASGSNPLVDIAWRDNLNFGMIESGSKTVVMDQATASSPNLLNFSTLSGNATSLAFNESGTQMVIGQVNGAVSVIDSASATINTTSWTIQDTISLNVGPDPISAVVRVAYHPSEDVVAATGTSSGRGAYAWLNLTSGNSDAWGLVGNATLLPNAYAGITFSGFYNSGLAWNPTGLSFNIAAVVTSSPLATDLATVTVGASALTFVTAAFGNSVASIMENPATFTLNPEQVPFFATNIDGLYGHPANLASQLAQFGGLTQAQAQALANRLYTYLAQTDYFGNEPHQNDTTGAASSVGGC